MREEADAIVVGAGLAGLVAAAELARAGKRVLVLDQEPEASLGGQAWWSFGGLFLVDTPEQRRMGIRDTAELAGQDWFASAGFDRDTDEWPRRWAEAYVDFAAGEKRDWLHSLGVRWFPIVGWAERGGRTALAHGNSVPRFHIVWGTGPGIVAPFERRVREAAAAGRAELRFRHRVDELIVEAGAVVGVRGAQLAEDGDERGAASSRDVTGDFELRAPAVVLTTGGIGGNHDLVRRYWPERLGAAPRSMLSGVPASVDGRGLGIAENAGARLVNTDRMWHYTEGITNHSPVWARHGIRILPGPSSLWLDPSGHRLPAPLFPGFDTLATLAHLTRAGHDHSWFVLTQRILEKEFALSGSEQNPDLTGKDLKLLARRIGKGAPAPVDAFAKQGEDFVVAPALPGLLEGMTRLSAGQLDTAQVEREIVARDRQIANPFTKDAQIALLRDARHYRGD
ncbi:MAG TPA: FAD-binding dehydrogenase, partial [Naasia sp.]